MFSKRRGKDRAIGPLNLHQTGIEVQLSDRKAHVSRLPSHDLNMMTTSSYGIVRSCLT